MELKDLIKGEIYYCTFDRDYLFEYDGTRSNVIYLDIINNSFSRTGWNFYTDKSVKNLRLSTRKEKAHLLACIKANKYVECPTIEENILENLIIW